MADESRARLLRLGRLLQIRETYVSVAETNVKQAEVEVRQCEKAEAQVAGQIKVTQAGIAYLKTASGHEIQTGERYIFALSQQRKQILQSLEKAAGNLVMRRREWTEAMREQKVIENLQERRLQLWRHDDDVAKQKTQDDNSISRYVRKRIEKTESPVKPAPKNKEGF